jgi:hypothetical protein
MNLLLQRQPQKIMVGPVLIPKVTIAKKRFND